MKKNLKIAKRYAKALMLLAHDENKVDDFRSKLADITFLLTSTDLSQAVLNPIYHNTQRRALLVGVLEKAQITETLFRFVTFLYDVTRLTEIDTINAVYQQMADELDGIARAEVLAAVAVPDKVTTNIAALVKKHSGRTVVFDVKQDASLIGGLVVRIGDYVYDGSVRTQINNMRESLKQGEDL